MSSSESSSSSSSSSSSATPPPSIPVPKNKKSVNNKGKNNSQTQDQGKNEGINPNWAFTPPPGSTLLEEEKDADAGEFDWDEINNDEDLELCLIRVPDSVKPKYLENLQLHKPISSVSPRSALLGVLKRKHTTFDIWSVGDGDDQPVGGEEMKDLSCLLPRKKKKGKLYPASKPFTHHLLFSAQSVIPTPCAPSTADDPQASILTGPPYKNPPRQSYPKEVLKHRFMPYGSLVNLTSNKMDVDNHEEIEEAVMNVDTVENPEPQPQPQPTIPPKARRKKRKNFNEVQLETPINPSTTTELQSEGGKTKEKKRKVESMADPSPVKKSKKIKIKT